MHIRFTKMQGAGNDFVVLDETAGLLGLTPAQYRWLADRHFGVGADQILGVRSPPQADVDFEYVIHNSDGGEVEHCGNGARCFVRYVRSRGLTDKQTVRVKVRHGVIELSERDDGQVTVNMGAPEFDLPAVPFNATALHPRPHADWQLWPLPLPAASPVGETRGGETHDGETPVAPVAVLSMGNPHAVLVVDDVTTAPVETYGPLIETHPAFPNRVNVGFMQILDRSHVRLRVFERGAGETLACGTGACAAVVAGIRLGLLDTRVEVATRGGALTIEWSGGASAPVWMTGPAATVFEGEIDIPDFLPDSGIDPFRPS